MLLLVIDFCDSLVCGEVVLYGEWFIPDDICFYYFSFVSGMLFMML